MDFEHYLSNRDYLRNFTQVLRSARKLRGISQEELADSLKTSPKLYSEWEEGIGYPDIAQWGKFCQLTGIDIDACRYGIVNGNSDIIIRNDKKIGLFEIPERYAFNQATANRYLSPFIEYLRFTLGESEFVKVFTEKFQIDPDYFCLHEQELNGQFSHDLFELLLKRKLSSDDLRTIARIGISKLYPCTLLQTYSTSIPPELFLLSVGQINNKLDLDLSYELIEELDESFYISISASENLRPIYSIENEALKLHHLYKKEWLSAAVLYLSGKNIIINDIEQAIHGEIDCLIQVQTA